MTRLRIVRHPVTPLLRLALMDGDTILASFESVPGTDPSTRLSDAKDYARSLKRSFVTHIDPPSRRTP